MKIGILTYHRVVNDGSILQAYCLQQIVSSYNPDAQVEIIDYRPLCGEHTEYRRLLSRDWPFFNIKNWRKMRSIRAFMERHCIFSPSCITDNLNTAKQFVQKQQYDMILVGSDTVWEARHSVFVPPFPNLYFLPELQKIRKISFAASADPIIPDYVQYQERSRQIRQSIDAFDFISVRDEATRAYLMELGTKPERLHFMPDPTLLWDFTSVVELPSPALKRKRLAGIAISIGDHWVRAKIETQLCSAGYKPVYLANAAQVEQALGVQINTVGQRVGLHGALDLLVTDRFHGSIFALKQAQIPVIFVETAQKWPKLNSKGRDLFQRLGIEGMVWRYESNEVPPDLIANRLDVWQKLAPNILSSLQEIRESAQVTLQQMFEQLIVAASVQSVSPLKGTN